MLCSLVNILVYLHWANAVFPYLSVSINSFFFFFLVFHIPSDILVTIFSFVSSSLGLGELRLKCCVLG